MYQLSCILFHMDLMDSHTFGSGGRFDLHMAVPAYGQIELGNLIVLRVIRVKIVFSVELAVSGDRTARCQAHTDGVFHNLFVQDGQGAGHPCAYRAGMGVGSASEGGGTAAEDFSSGSQFHMNLQADYCFILFCHFLMPPFRPYLHLQCRLPFWRFFLPMPG